MRTRMIFAIITAVILSAVLLVWFGLFSKLDRKLILEPTQKITIDGNERSYRVAEFSESTDQKPLVIGLHGFQDRGLWHGLYSGLHILSEQEDVIVALPEGDHQSWNAEFCCGYAYENDVNDTEFIMKMIEEIKSESNVDESRIYVMGFSNGGAFAQRLLEEQPDVFSGAGSVMSGVGSPSERLSIGSATGRVALFQGEDDQYVPLDPNDSTPPGFRFLSAQTTKKAWVNHFGATLQDSENTANYKEEVYADSSGPKVLFRVYKDTSHRWPMWRLWTLPNSVPESTQAMWNFLNS